MYRVVKNVLKITVLVLSLLVISLTVILQTQTGAIYTTYLFNHLFEDVIECTLPQGTLTSQLHFDSIQIHLKQHMIVLEDSTIELALLPLLYQALELKSLHIKRTTIPDLSLLALKDIQGQLLLSRQNIHAILSYHNPQFKLHHEISVAGSPSDYRLQSNLNIGTSQSILQGVGNKDSFTIQSALQDPLQATLQLSWKEQLQWSLSVYSEQNSTKTNTRIHSAGNLDNYSTSIQHDGPIFTNSPIQIYGNLDKTPTKTQGELHMQSADNQLDIQATIANAIDATITADIDNLNQWLPESFGDISGQAQFSGTTNAPELSGKLSINQLDTPHLSIENLASSIAYQKRNKNPLSLALTAQHIQFANHNMDTISTSLMGTLESPELTIDITQGKHTIKGNISTSLTDGYSTINTLAIHGLTEPLTLVEPVTFFWNKPSISLPKFCLANQNQHACVKGWIQPFKQHIGLHIAAERFPIDAIVQPEITEYTQITSANMTGTADIFYNNTFWEIHEIDSKFNDMILALPTLNTRLPLSLVTLKNDIDHIRIEANTKHDAMRMTLHAQYINNQRLKGSLQGEHIPIIQTDFMHASITPNIAFDIYEKIRLNGTIQTDNSTINIQDTYRIKGLPDDVLFVKQEHKKHVSQSISWQPDSSLIISANTGNTLHAMDSVSQFSGTLHLYPDMNQEIRANGTLTLSNGTLTKYGQQLAIENSALIFQDNRLMDPQLSIEAIRYIEPDIQDLQAQNLVGTMAGIRVTGTALEPNVRLFSSPEGLSDNEIIAILVTGQPFTIQDYDLTGYSAPFDPIAFSSNILNTMGAFKALSKTLPIDGIYLNKTEINSNDIDNTHNTNVNVVIQKDVDKNIFLKGMFGIYSNDYTISAQYNINPDMMMNYYTSPSTHGINFLYRFYTD